MQSLIQDIKTLKLDICQDTKACLVDVRAGKNEIDVSIRKIKSNAQSYLERIQEHKKLLNGKLTVMEESARETVNRLMITHADVEVRIKELLRNCEGSK